MADKRPTHSGLERDGIHHASMHHLWHVLGAPQQFPIGVRGGRGDVDRVEGEGGAACRALYISLDSKLAIDYDSSVSEH